MNDQQLDKHLEQLKQNQVEAPAFLAPRIVANLDDSSPVDQLVARLINPLWRPVALAAFPLLIGFTLGVTGVPSSSGADIWYEADALVFADEVEAYDYDEF